MRLAKVARMQSERRWREVKARLRAIDAAIEAGYQLDEACDGAFGPWLAAWDRLVDCLRVTPGLTLVAIDLALEADVYEWLDALLEIIAQRRTYPVSRDRVREVLREYLDVLDGSFPGGDIKVRSLFAAWSND